MGFPKARQKLADADELELDAVEDERCHLRYSWQKSMYPTCNIVHEFDGTTPSSSSSGWQRRHGPDSRLQKLYRLAGHGFWRDVWIVNYNNNKNNNNNDTNDNRVGEKGVFKTMRWLHDFTPRNFDRMRRDGLAMERLTASPFIIGIYSFCGTSSMSEFGEGGDISDALWPLDEGPELSQIQKLRIGKSRTCITFILN